MKNEIHSKIRNLLIQSAQQSSHSIAFPDALDIRVLEAANVIYQQKLGNAVLIGKRQDIENLANIHGIDIQNIEIRDPELSITAEYVSALMLSHSGIESETEARKLLLNPLYFAGIAVKNGDFHGCVAGNISTTGDVIKAGLKTVGLAEGINTVSSFFVMTFPEHVLFYADCAVVPSPTVEQLSDIAAMTAVHYKKLTNNNPKVAFLSFSTKGSSAHQDAKKVNDAYTLFTSKYPHIISDGELQLDAALIPQIAQKKAPESPLSGDANILIFPDLDAGNIAYKISERLAGASAIGPIVQGLNKPYCDLSRGCSMEDIIDVALICMSM